MCQYILFDVEGVEIDINTRDQSNVEGVEDRSNTPKGCNAMYVEDVKDRSHTPKGCNAMYVKDVKDVKDRSNTPKGCNAMYVEDIEDGIRTYRHTFIIPFLIWYHLNVILCMSKMLKIDQIHLSAVMLCMLKMLKIHQIHPRAVMLCMSKMSKMGKEHTHTFWLITSLLLDGFSI